VWPLLHKHDDHRGYARCDPQGPGGCLNPGLRRRRAGQGRGLGCGHHRPAGPVLLAASLAANVAVAEPTVTGRVIAAWPSFALIAAYELLMRQVRHGAARGVAFTSGRPRPQSPRHEAPASAQSSNRNHPSRASRQRKSAAALDLQRAAWQWAQVNRAKDGSLPSGKEIGRQYGRHERWGRLVKRAGTAGEFSVGNAPDDRYGDKEEVLAAAAT
jgi:hypothetical protein